MANFIGGIISITLGVIVLANVFMTTVHNANTTGWSTSEVANLKDPSFRSTVMECFGLSRCYRNPIRNSLSIRSYVRTHKLIRLAYSEA